MVLIQVFEEETAPHCMRTRISGYCRACSSQGAATVGSRAEAMMAELLGRASLELAA